MKLTAEDILALPQYAAQMRTIVCKCGHRINIPFMAELRASYHGGDDIISVVDKDGVAWMPVETEFGWVRRRLG